MKLTKKEMKQIKGGGVGFGPPCDPIIQKGFCWDGTPIYYSFPLGTIPHCNYSVVTLCPPQS